MFSLELVADIAGIAYLQPFIDGNKRTGRLHRHDDIVRTGGYKIPQQSHLRRLCDHSAVLSCGSDHQESTAIYRNQDAATP
ncbi:Fic family protein [Aminobacter sp. MDW-2]|nr:hypothetical protein [Aminobacter sp. MDW-2]QNH33911.1 Fic family protein [Aminobacter sp. MDW-2]